MNIVIIGAMQEEITLIAAQLSNSETQKVGHLSVLTGNINQNHIALVQCGMGNDA